MAVNPFIPSLGFPKSLNNSNAQGQSGFASDTYLSGSNVIIPPGSLQAGDIYHCLFDFTKTGAGTAAIVITVRGGTTGTVSDASLGTITFGAQTAAIDTGIFEILAAVKSVGLGTSAVLQLMSRLDHNLATTGLSSGGAGGFQLVTNAGSGFDSSFNGGLTNIGLSFNGGASFSGTNTIVNANLIQA